MKSALRYLLLLFLLALVLSAYFRDRITWTSLIWTKEGKLFHTMIAVPLTDQRGYSKFTAFVLNKAHEQMLKHTHVFRSEKMEISKGTIRQWYGSKVTLHRHQRADNLLENIFEMLEYFTKTGYDNLLIASCDLVFSPNVSDFIKDNINRTDLLHTYRQRTSCRSLAEDLCVEPTARIIGSAMKKPFAELLLRNPDWLKDSNGLDAVVSGVEVTSLSPYDSLSVRIGQNITDGKCTRYAESKNFDRCQFSAEIQRGIEFFYDKCNPPTVYFDGNSLNDDAFYAKPAVVYSFYGGENPRYTDGVPANCKLMSLVYPEWKMWVYHDNSFPDETMKTLCKCDAKLVNMVGSNITNKRTWRFLIASEKVRRYIVRDIDSRLSFRERFAVEEWVNSSKKFHVMRDHPAHAEFAMNAGMWGGVYGALPELKEKLESLSVNEWKTQDQNFLTSNVWPIVSKSVLQHDSFPSKYGVVHPFPTPRKGYEHVGSVYINCKPRQYDINVMKRVLDSTAI